MNVVCSFFSFIYFNLITNTSVLKAVGHFFALFKNKDKIFKVLDLFRFKWFIDSNFQIEKWIKRDKLSVQQNYNWLMYSSEWAKRKAYSTTPSSSSSLHFSNSLDAVGVEEKDLPNECPRYDTKQSHGEALVCRSFGECGICLHCSRFQVHFGLDL